jgi:tripeptide aminopeptidase
MDTSPAVSGKDVKPRIIKNYDGNDYLLKPGMFPELNNHLGEDLIATDGTTLLGADDKAGVAEIMFALRYLAGHPEIRHRKIRVCFTPDEEIGAGVDHIDLEKFGAKEAYTVDGGKLGELEYECFNAAWATVTVRGTSVHPGSAKNLMKNASLLAIEFNSLLPAAERPEHTEGREGFYMLGEISGSIDSATLKYIIRDHDRAKFEAKKAFIARCVAFINEKYGEGTAEAEIKDQYYNMREQVEPHYEIVRKAVKAMEMAGIRPKIQPIRGGTDGANLSFKGLPCPNIFAGGLNFHGKMEFVSLQSMEKASAVILNILGLFAEA